MTHVRGKSTGSNPRWFKKVILQSTTPVTNNKVPQLPLNLLRIPGVAEVGCCLWLCGVVIWGGIYWYRNRYRILDAGMWMPVRIPYLSSSKCLKVQLFESISHWYTGWFLQKSVGELSWTSCCFAVDIESNSSHFACWKQISNRSNVANVQPEILTDFSDLSGKTGKSPAGLILYIIEKLQHQEKHTSNLALLTVLFSG